jgi:hypothetical protein
MKNAIMAIQEEAQVISKQVKMEELIDKGF